MFNFFKKKDDEPENIESVEENTFMKLWHNKRTHAAMVLGLWMVFLIFVMLIAFIGGEAKESLPQNNIEQQKEQIVFKDYTEMQNNLLKKNYSYEYNIKTGEYQVIYKGEINNNIDKGYRENLNGTIKYQVDETGLYEVVMDSLNSYDKLYENIVEDYIDVTKILELVKDKTVTKEETEKVRTYTYNFELDSILYEIKVITNTEEITDITIKYENNEYLLKYNNINKPEEGSQLE